MFLTEFSFKQKNIFDRNDLIIEKITFDECNLIVGKNGMGKSTLTNHLFLIAQIISGAENNLIDGEWILKFSKDGKEMTYILRIAKGSVITEKIYEDEINLLQRDRIHAQIFSKEDNYEIDFNPPESSVIFRVRRDKKHHPFLEEIVEWAENLYFFNFGAITPSSSISNTKVIRSTDSKNSYIPHLIQELKTFEDREKIINGFNDLGFNIRDFEYNPNNNLIFLKEKGLESKIPQSNISQGMFRSILLLVFMDFVGNSKKPITLIIDDMCEGLDYERALNLGKAILKKIEYSNIQLILTSNDSFLMEVIPIEYWNILTREKSVIKTANYQNSKAKFDEFKFTGLSNFDLFSSDYLIENK